MFVPGWEGLPHLQVHRQGRQQGLQQAQKRLWAHIQGNSGFLDEINQLLII